MRLLFAVLVLLCSNAFSASFVTVTLTDTPDPLNAGSQLTYTITTTNAGPDDAIDMSVALPVPVPAILVSAVADNGGTCSGNPAVVCAWIGATPAATRTATIVVIVPATTPPGTLSAIATASAVNAPAVNASTSTTIRRRRVPAP